MSQQRIEIPRQVGQYVRDKREELGLTRPQAARRAGVSERLLASLELGEAPGIRLDKLMAVLHALDLELYVRSEDNIGEGDERPEIAREQVTPFARQDETRAPAGAHAPYDELYRSFVQAQGVRRPISTDFEGRE